MTILGSIFMAAGLVLSLAVFAHDVRRLRIGRDFGGQSAPGRIAPEVHVVAALLLGAGVGVIWGWRMGCIGAVGHGVAAYLLVRPLIHR
jgi:hypothetical protein